MNINDPTDAIYSREDFVAFVRSLARNFQDNPDEWENINIWSYLDALAAWTEDMDGLFHNTGQPLPTNIDWKLIARLLLAAKIYE
jgi:hypothetical protein